MIDLNKIAIIAGEHNVTYSELLQRVAQYAKKTPKGKQTKTLIFSENREGWAYSFFSVWQNEGIAVPVDASSTASDVAYILNDCKPDAVWVSREREAVLREALAPNHSPLTTYIIDDYESLPLADEHPTSILPWNALSEPDNTDTALIIYTSGTTGSPKGVMLSYAALKANVHSVSYDVPIYSEKRRALVLLPLHHVLPLMGSLIAPLYMGGGIAISPSLSGPDIMDTLQRGQVGIMIGVPRLWQTLFVGIKKKIDQTAVGRMLFALCSTLKCRTLSRIVFGSVRKKMGGHIDYLVSGGAALDREIGEGLRTLGLDVLEGYGMTETAPIIAFTRPGDYIPGCSGLPLPGVDCKLVNGELCVKGPNLMSGYFNRPEETSAVIDSDGYLHTGDLAEFDSVGRITITGRTKEIIVLSNGKNVQPSEIEYKLEKYDSLVKEAAVVQDGDMLRAIIVPQPAWASTMTDAETAAALKRDVLEPYNKTVSAYKKIMSVLVYRGELPRTRLDKLQRYKLGEILKEGKSARENERKRAVEPTFEEYLSIKHFIETEKGITVHATDHIETDLALDSLDKISLQTFIENTFGTSVGVDAMPDFANIEALARHVAARKGARSKEQGAREYQQPEQYSCSLPPAASPHPSPAGEGVFPLKGDAGSILPLKGEGGSWSLPLPTAGFTYRLTSRIFKLFFRCYNSLKIKGAENIPAEGACILAPNHQSFIDGPLVLSALPWNKLGEYFFYATEEHVRGRRRRLAAKSNVIVMERADLKNSILKLAKVLREGHRVIIFPEGARTHDGQTVPFKKTFAILAKDLEVPIVPVCIRGAYEALPRGSRFVSPKHIEVTFLPAINGARSKEQGAGELSYEELTKQTQHAIEALLAR